MILSSLHLDAEVAAQEAAHIDEMIELVAEVMGTAQTGGELSGDRDSKFIGAMLTGGMRHVLAIALAASPPIRQELTGQRLWVLNATVMGIDPDVDGR